MQTFQVTIRLVRLLQSRAHELPLIEDGLLLGVKNVVAGNLVLLDSLELLSLSLIHWNSLPQPLTLLRIL